ncbi:MAG TPA: TonB-dependent receptor, partial [Woeseiaceae bacterium]|nr:TonB-dependent receptor [Woeseiaceae bacterium]
VHEDYRVQAEPLSEDPEEALREVLAPFGLSVTDGPAGTLLITKSEPAAALTVRVIDADLGSGIAGARVSLDGAPAGHTDAAGRLSIGNITPGRHRVAASADGYEEEAEVEFRATGDATVPLRLEPAPAPLPEIIVTSSHYNIRYQQSGSHTFLDRKLTTKLPHLGDEALRSIARLPGATGGGISSRSHVRGGLKNEQLFLLDGLRLYEPYHLKDFQSITTIVDQSVIAGIDFYSAGYQAHYGDRMSGVVDIALREPPEHTETQLGLTFFHTSALSRGRFGGNDRGDWLVAGRRSNLDLLAEAVNPNHGEPRYQDYLGHVGWDIGGHTYFSGNMLFATDELSLSRLAGSEQASATYRNEILWLKAETQWNDRISSSTILSVTEIENERSGTTDRPGVITGFVDDEREFRSRALKQDWEYDIADRWLLRSGFELKWLDAEYAYEASLNIASPFDRILDNRAAETRGIEVSPRGSQYAGYTELRWQPAGSLTLDLGLRWDQQTYTTADDDEQVSPRLNLLWRAGSDTDIRLAFGDYYQAQEINELQVSDGIVDFHPAQHARHWVASLTHGFPQELELRVEAYRKKYDDLMPRFENVFNPLVLIPELQIDRARIDADAAAAKGVEITLSGSSDALSWWASYAWSRSVDRIAGETIRRSWDQTHSLSAGISRDWNHWSFSAAAVARTGWPKTALVGETVQNPDGSTGLALAVERRNSRRHGAFESLDVRASRHLDLPKGELDAFIEVTNLYDRRNPCCTEYGVALDADGTPHLLAEERTWLPFVPSLGVIWRF